MALLSQASPVDWWKSEFAREEEKEILEEVAAHIISELESEMMIQQDEECLQSTFQYRMHAVLTEQFRRVTDGDTGQVEFIFNNLLNFTCISSDYSLFVSKNGGKFEKAINSAIIYTCDLVNRSYQSSIRDKGEPRCAIPCMKLQNIQNGTVSVEGNQPPLENDTAKYSCDSGYQLSGTRTRTCDEDGQWSGQEPSCIPQCPELQDIANGDVDYTSRQPGGTATYSCDPGYVLQGATTRICGEDGEWSGQEPSCKRIPQCPELQEIANGDVNYTSRQPGANATYSCNSGYVLQGAETRTCGQDRKWSGQEPKCVRLCPVLVAPLNGAVNYDNRSREPGDVATYSCRDGYRLVGPEMRICARDQDGKWSGIHPVCEILCPLVNPIPHGGMNADRSPVPGTGGRFPVDTVVNYTCDNGYLLCGEDTRICLRSGEWDRPEPNCHVRLCPELSAPLNGAVSYRNREPGDVATYSCRNGYRLVGPETRMCVRDQDGISKWSGNHSVCETIVCPLVNPIPNGDMDPSKSPIPGRGFPVDTVITYTCENGYLLRGEATRMCLRSGEWDRPEPSCGPLAVRCPELKLSGNPRSVEEIRKQIERDRPKNYLELLSEPFFKKNIKGNPGHYDLGSKAYLECIKPWKLMSGSPSVQTCERNTTTGELYWTKPGICVYRYYTIRPTG